MVGTEQSAENTNRAFKQIHVTRDAERQVMCDPVSRFFEL